MKNSEGLTKREYFAGLALNGLMSDIETVFAAAPKDKAPAKHVAQVAVKLSDALLEELESTQP